jgi:PAS domain S-box-containing protein
VSTENKAAKEKVTGKSSSSTPTKEDFLLSQAVFDRMPDGVAVVRDNRIITANPALGSLTATPVGELPGRSLLNLFSRQARPEVENLLTLCRNEGKRPPFAELELAGRDGVFRDVELSCQSYKKNEQVTQLFFFRDISWKKRYQKDVESKIRHITAVQEAFALAIEAENPVDLSEKILSLLGNYLIVDAFWISEYEPRTNLVREILEADTFEGRLKTTIYKNQASEATPTLRHLFNSSEPLLELRESERALDEKYFEPFGDTDRRSASLMFVPMRYREITRGVISVQSYQYAAYTRSDMDLLADVANVVGQALSRMQAERTWEESENIYRKVISFANGVPYRRDLIEGKYSFFGEGIYQLTGYEAREMTLELWEIMVQETVPRGPFSGLPPKEALDQARKQGARNWQADYRIKTRDGSIRWISDFSMQIESDGVITGSIGILQDITERKITEARLVEQNQRLQIQNDVAQITTGSFRQEEIC